MRIHLVSGYHLTAQHRKNLSAMLARGMMAGKVGRTTYHLTRTESGAIDVRQVHNEANDQGQQVERVSRYTIEAS
jgi:hypothetical protein